MDWKRTNAPHLNLRDRLAAALRWGSLVVFVLAFLWSTLVVGRSWLKSIHSASTLTLRVMFWGSPNEVQDVKSAIDQFKQIHSHIRIVPIPVSGPYYTKLDSMLAAGDPPDIMYVSDSRLAQLAHDHVLKNLYPMIAARLNAGRMRWFNEYYPKVLGAFRLGTRQHPAYYGLPKDFSTMVMYINVRLFRQARLPIPYNGWTWRTFQHDVKLITIRCQTGRAPIFGGALVTTSQELRNIVWTFGGHFFNPIHPDDLDLINYRTMSALHFIRRLRFKLGVLYNHIGVGFTQRSLRAFLAGRVGVIGPWGRWFVPQCRAERHLHFDVVPLPHVRGVEPPSLIFTVAWGMAAKCQHPRTAFKLLTYLAGPPGQLITTREGLSVPSLQSLAQGRQFLTPHTQPKNSKLFLTEAYRGRIERGIRENHTFNQLLQNTIGESIDLNNGTPEAGAVTMAHRWRAVINSPLWKRPFSAMPWPELVASCIVLIGLGGLLLSLWALRQRWTAEAMSGLMFISPWLAGFLGLTLLPMVVSFFLSLTRWRPITPISAAQFVGVTNYQQILFHDPHFLHSLLITFMYTALALPLGQCIALVLAILLNRRLKGAAGFRFIVLIPLAVSSVCLGTLWLTMFNAQHGLINELLTPPLSLVELHPPNWFGSDARLWAVPAFVIMSFWTLGGAVIIYLAGLSRISGSLYEAAIIDGAGTWRRFFCITLPMLSPIIFFNLVVSLIASLQIFSQAQVMTNGRPGDTSLFYVLYIFQQGFEYFHFGYAAALSWLLFVFILGLTILVFRLARRYVSYEGVWL